MKINNFKNYVDWKSIKKKFALVAISVAIGSMVTGCNQNVNNEEVSNTNINIYQSLSEEKLDTDTTTVEERAAYYDKYVDNIFEEMTDAEKLNYYVNIKVNYTGRENFEGDNIIFLRNDNVYEGDLFDGDDTIGIAPGVYRIISAKAEENGNFGDITILTPGEDITLNVDYNNYKVTVDEGQKTK